LGGQNFLQGGQAPLAPPLAPALQKCVTCERSVCISPYSEALISATCDRWFDNQTVLLEPLTQFQFRRFALARSLNRCENGETICRIINYNPQALVLLRGTKLAKIEPLSVVSSCKLFNEHIDLEGYNGLGAVVSQPQSNEVLEHFCQEYGFNINPKLTPDQRRELLSSSLFLSPFFPPSLSLSLPFFSFPLPSLPLPLEVGPLFQYSGAGAA